MPGLKAAAITLGVLTPVLLVIGFASKPVIHSVVVSQVEKATVVDSFDSKLFAQWKSPTLNIYMKYYMWNITNTAEVLEGGKPVMQQLGPYVYLEYRDKQNITFAADQETVSFTLFTKYTFQPHLSGGLLESDRIAQVNLPLFGIAAQVHTSALEQDVMKVVIEFFFGKSEMFFYHHTVGELLWGFDDPLLHAVCDHELTRKFCASKGITPRFSLQNNNTRVAIRTKTGRSNVREVFEYEMWRDMETLTFWNSPQCRMLNGTDGTMFHPNLQRTDVLAVYVDDIFRSAYVQYYQDLAYKGVQLYQFRMQSDALMNATENPFNRGFNDFGPSGVLNETAVPDYKGVGVFASKPHFLGAAPVYRENVVGMRPDEEAHDTLLNLEPYSGVVFEAYKRMQINALSSPIHWLPATKGVKEVMMPMLWAEESGIMDDDDLATFKSQVYTPLDIAKGMQIGGLVVGVLCLGLLIFVLAKFRRQQRANAAESVRLINDGKPVGKSSLNYD